MKKTLDRVRGTVRVCTRCRFPERLINICAGNHIEFWDLERKDDGSAHMTVYISGYRALRRLAARGDFTVKPVSRRGMPFFLWGIRRRYVLFLGMAMCFGAVWLSSLFIWQIEVTGNTSVPEEEILANLRELGVGIGTGVFTIDRDALQNKMLLRMPELSWMTVNTYGSRANVIVREKIEKPVIRDKRIPADVVAEKSGVVTKVECHRGTPLVEKGDPVISGDVLISSQVQSNSGSSTVGASGKVWAGTFYKMTASMPLEYVEKQYTGKETSRHSLVLGEKRGKLYFSGGNPYALCDKITVYNNITLPGGSRLPLAICKDTFREYVGVIKELSAEEAQPVLEARLLSQLQQQIAGGAVLEQRFESLVEDGLITVTLYARCSEEISITVPRD